MNYFKYLKWLLWVFVILSVISIPAVLLNIYGPSTFSTGLSNLAETTIGHLAYSEANSTLLVTIPGCYNYGGFTVNCELTKEQLSGFYSWLDIAISIVIIVAFFWVRYFSQREDIAIEKDTIYTSMYGIMLKNLPENCDHDMLEIYFRKTAKEFRIISISFLHDDENIINLCRDRGNYLKEKKRILNKHRFECTRIRMSVGKEKGDRDRAELEVRKARESFVGEIKHVDEKLMAVQKELNKASKAKRKAPLAAFVIFEDDAASNVILARYHRLTYFNYFFGKHEFIMEGKRIRVYPSPEPSTIIWENYGYGIFNRLFRRFLTTILAFFLIFLSVVVTFGTKYFEVTGSTSSDSTVLCPEHFSSLSRSQQQVIVENNPQYTDCYCSSLNDLQQASDSLCNAYFKHRVYSQLLTFLSSMVVLMINTVIDISILAFANFEKHHSEDGKGRSIFIRNFILKYINTSCVFLINNHYIFRKVFNISQQSTVQFSSSWYNTVGVTIILVQLGDIISSHSNQVGLICLVILHMSTYMSDLNRLCLLFFLLS